MAIGDPSEIGSVLGTNSPPPGENLGLGRPLLAPGTCTWRASPGVRRGSCGIRVEFGLEPLDMAVVGVVRGAGEEVAELFEVADRKSHHPSGPVVPGGVHDPVRICGVGDEMYRCVGHVSRVAAALKSSEAVERGNYGEAPNIRDLPRGG